MKLDALIPAHFWRDRRGVLQVNNSSLERFILLQMLGQCVAMAKVMVGFKANHDARS